VGGWGGGEGNRHHAGAPCSRSLEQLLQTTIVLQLGGGAQAPHPCSCFQALGSSMLLPVISGIRGPSSAAGVSHWGCRRGAAGIPPKGLFATVASSYYSSLQCVGGGGVQPRHPCRCSQGWAPACCYPLLVSSEVRPTDSDGGCRVCVWGGGGQSRLAAGPPAYTAVRHVGYRYGRLLQCSVCHGGCHVGATPPIQ